MHQRTERGGLGIDRGKMWVIEEQDRRKRMSGYSDMEPGRAVCQNKYREMGRK